MLALSHSELPRHFLGRDPLVSVASLTLSRGYFLMSRYSEHVSKFCPHEPAALLVAQYPSSSEAQNSHLQDLLSPLNHVIETCSSSVDMNTRVASPLMYIKLKLRTGVLISLSLSTSSTNYSLFNPITTSSHGPSVCHLKGRHRSQQWTPTLWALLQRK